MHGLPQSSTVRQMLPKKTLYEKFGFTNQERMKFDRSVHKMTIVAEISPKTVNIAPGKEVGSFYIIEVELQSERYDRKSIESIFKLINQNLVLILLLKEQYRFAVFKEVLLESDWRDIDSLSFELVGLDLDTVWENAIKSIGNIELIGESSLEEQIIRDMKQKDLRSKAEALDKKARIEKQPRTKRKMYEELQELKSEIE